jgi:hypothetical protein
MKIQPCVDTISNIIIKQIDIRKIVIYIFEYKYTSFIKLNKEHI